VIALPDRDVLLTAREPGLRDSRPLTNETLFTLDRLPSSLAILGGGPIGCEMAQAFALLGSTVSLVEAADRLLHREEPDASAVVERALTRDGVDVRTRAKATLVERLADDRVCIHTETGDPITATHLLAAIGLDCSDQLSVETRPRPQLPPRHLRHPVGHVHEP
jgi:pyruvate/2-oxoglutarate dehydrogenase complex dihydrolipoamide dehydrogenase (E3) component